MSKNKFAVLLTALRFDNPNDRPIRKPFIKKIFLKKCRFRRLNKVFRYPHVVLQRGEDIYSNVTLKQFEELSARHKKHRFEELRAKYSKEELLFSTKIYLW